MRPPVTLGLTAWSRYSNDVTTPKFAPAPRTAQNRVAVFVFGRGQDAAFGSHDLDRREVVECDAVLAHEVPHAATVPKKDRLYRVSCG